MIPRIPHATSSPNELVSLGDQVRVTCDMGYGVHGSKVMTTQTITCMADQTFDSAEPCLGTYAHVAIDIF